MNESSYEEYKRNLYRDQKKKNDLHDGRVLLVLGVAFILYLLWILPFHADNVSEIRGDEVQAATSQYDPQRVYYIENLQILRARKSTDDDEIYCIAKFEDHDLREWLISLTPGSNGRLAEQLEASIRFKDEPDLTVSGYFQMQDLKLLPFEADSFYSVYGKSYADSEGENMLGMNAECLCDQYGNYMVEMLSHPGIPFGTLVAAVISLLWGGFLFIRNRTRKEV
ncbi:MAG: hypothetical protein NC413_06270 [Muribaculum sp.]|nr:hypothetical protein [Muribaculum sp.]